MVFMFYKVVKEYHKRIKKMQKDNLAYLDLSCCGLKEIPEEVYELKHLKGLYLTNFRPVYTGPYCSTDEVIDKIVMLSKEYKVEIDIEKDYSGDFVYKSVSEENIKDNPESPNTIVSISSSISCLKDLEVLDLSDNQLKNLLVEITHLSKLKYADHLQKVVRKITRTLIDKGLYESASHAYYLERRLGLWVNNNPLDTPPYSIAVKGLTYIESFFDDAYN